MSSTSSLPPSLTYKNRQLHMEDVPLGSSGTETGTPAYVYSKARLLDNFHRFDDAFKAMSHQVLFAMKANSSGAILSILGKAGAGADIVSAGELFRARRAGIPADRIVFSGVGKRVDEIRMALEAGILLFNVESVEELQMIDRVAASIHKAAPISIRINPDVDALTHDHITTGKKENKFGIALDKSLPVFRMAAKLPRINLLGVQAHIGSQITSTRPYTATLNKVLNLIDKLETEGIHLRYIDLGGGLGVRYKDEKPPTPKQLAEELHSRLRGREIKLLLEPGRYLVADSGVLLTRVLYRKMAGSKHFIIVDAAMNDLARPALYDAYHGVYPVLDKKGRKVTADIVGPVCESSDYLARNRSIRLLEQGEALVVTTAGAYGYVMGSQYNSRPRLPEILVHGNKWTLIRERETLDDLVRGEHIPADLVEPTSFPAVSGGESMDPLPGAAGDDERMNIMKTIKFWKMSGSGNDFVVIDNRHHALRGNLARWAKKLCHRQFGVGADGLLLLESDKKEDFRMVYYNADGSRADMCGNGARCMAWFAHAKGAVGNAFRFTTDAYPVGATVKGAIVKVSLADARDYTNPRSRPKWMENISACFFKYRRASCGAVCPGCR